MSPSPLAEVIRLTRILDIWGQVVG